MGWFETWLKNLRHELDERDLWGELVAQRSALQAGPGADNNAPFTVDERRQITEHLARVEGQIAVSRSLSVEQTRFLHERLEDMRTAAERLGRKDWQIFALGIVATLIISAAFAPDEARAVAQEVAQALNWLATHSPRLPR
jgi:hypothetical protein